MKKKVLAVSSALVLFAFCTFGIHAQEETAKVQLIFINEDVVKPSMAGKYDNAIKEFWTAMKSHGLALPSIHASMREDFHYYYIIPLESQGDAE